MRAAISVFSQFQPHPHMRVATDFWKTRDSLVSVSRRIMQIMSEGRRALSTPDATQWKVLALARWELLRALTHIATLSKSEDITTSLDILGLASEKIERLGSMMLDLQVLYEAFVKKWALKSPLSVHEQYRDEAFAMAAQIEDRVRSYMRELCAVLDAQGSAFG